MPFRFCLSAGEPANPMPVRRCKKAQVGDTAWAKDCPDYRISYDGGDEDPRLTMELRSDGA